MDGCHVAYRCRVAVCCVVLCRKEVGMMMVCTVRINQLSEREGVDFIIKHVDSSSSSRSK